MFGKMKWEQLLAPAVKLAANGFPLHPRAANLLKINLKEFERYPATLKIFTNNGTPYATGDVLKQPDLAETLALIAKNGRDGFYKGPSPKRSRRK